MTTINFWNEVDIISNMKQTFTKYLPCARLWTTYTKKEKKS